MHRPQAGTSSAATNMEFPDACGPEYSASMEMGWAPRVSRGFYPDSAPYRFHTVPGAILEKRDISQFWLDVVRSCVPALILSGFLRDFGVPAPRVELGHCCQYWILSPARLPIPPRRRGVVCCHNGLQGLENRATGKIEGVSNRSFVLSARIVAGWRILVFGF